MWFRDDLRLADNPALVAAVVSGLPVLCVYVDSLGETWSKGNAQLVALSSALESLEQRLRAKGTSLQVLRLNSELDFADFCIEENASRVFWNRRYDRKSLATDTAIQKKLSAANIGVETFQASVLLEPWNMTQENGRPYQVYTPLLNLYKKRLPQVALAVEPERIVGAPISARSISVELAQKRWLPKIPWDKEISRRWVMSESEAHQRLTHFLKDAAHRYQTTRDLPFCEEGTSRLSPYLALGVISPRQIFWEVSRSEEAVFSSDPGVHQFQKELIWREFGYHLIYHFPHTVEEPLRENFKNFPWETNEIHMESWRRGQTGYPIVDAAMRELWTTGWMHNRARMIVASFLVKHLRLHWLQGARWFWDTLVDADLASNTLNWQWAAGSGADAAPYFRIFNPTLQGQRFDPEGEYVRRWVPELTRLGSKWIHEPWEADDAILRAAGVQLGVTYPFPIVDHQTERQNALAAFQKISGKLKEDGRT